MPTKMKALGSIRAVLDAIRGGDVSYFPRIKGSDGEERRLDPDEMIIRISKELDTLEEPADVQIEALIRRGRESLDEIKGLTEYEDQKATRNLTIITFLSALAGVLFSRFSDLYPAQKITGHFGAFSLEGGLVIAGYILFFVFVMCVTSGALVIFHATRIRFKYRDLAAAQENDRPKTAKSFLFFSEIIQTTPERWAHSFLEDRSKSFETKTFRRNLSLAYLKNYIIESYLIAAKVADKLRYLTPAQTILSFSIKILLLWLVAAAATVIIVPDQGVNAREPIKEVSRAPRESRL